MTIYYLYVKTHNKTGLKYLGQTKSKDPHKYPGSGKYWQSHLKTHGKDYTTEILHECQSVDELREKGLHYSQLWDVVKSNEWANLKEESGDGGFVPGPKSAEWRANHAESQRKKSQDPEWRARQAERARKRAQDPEWRAKNAERLRKIAQDPTRCAKISEAAKKRAQDPKWRAMMSERTRKKAQDPEHRAKMSEAIRKKYQDPEYRAKMLEARRKRAQRHLIP